jgi:hypothetical protein
VEQVIRPGHILRQTDGIFQHCWKSPTASVEIEDYSTCATKQFKQWELWRNSGRVIEDGISAIFIKPGIHATVTTKVGSRQLDHWCTIIPVYAYATAIDICRRGFFNSNRHFHRRMLSFTDTIAEYSNSLDLGLGSGSSAVYPSTSLHPQLERYIE